MEAQVAQSKKQSLAKSQIASSQSSKWVALVDGVIGVHALQHAVTELALAPTAFRLPLLMEAQVAHTKREIHKQRLAKSQIALMEIRSFVNGYTCEKDPLSGANPDLTFSMCRWHWAFSNIHV
jgi:hypothetical protein